MKYELIKNTVEISCKEEIYEGCTLDQQDQEPEILKSFDDKAEALKALESHDTEIQRLSGGSGTYYSVTEYYVQENEYDEDGSWIGGGDVWAFSKMPEEIE